MYCLDQSGKEYVYRNEISKIDNVDDLVKRFIEDDGVGAGQKVHLEDRRLRFFFEDIRMEIHPHLANILGFTSVCRGFTYTGKKGFEYTTSYDIINIPL